MDTTGHRGLRAPQGHKQPDAKSDFPGERSTSRSEKLGKGRQERRQVPPGQSKHSAPTPLTSALGAHQLPAPFPQPPSAGQGRFPSQGPKIHRALGPKKRTLEKIKLPLPALTPSSPLTTVTRSPSTKNLLGRH